MTFDEHLAREIVQSERLRMGALVVFLIALLAVLAVLYQVYYEDYQRHFTGPGGLRSAFAVIGGLILYELTARHVAGRRAAAGLGVPQALRYLNAFIEISCTSLLMVLVARKTNPTFVLQGAAVFIYGIFIVLSTLRLDRRLCLFTGAVAAIEFVWLSAYYAGKGGHLLASTPLESPPFYLAKGAVLLLTGMAAGFVAHQLKRRVGNAFRAQEERQRILGAFGQQVSPAIVDALMRQGGDIASRRAFVCILFIDIRNFTPMVEKMTPEEIVALQNSVFSVGIDVVNRHHGVINQFLGDGFMATFGAPVPGEEDCRNALAAARELVARLPMRVGIGLHAGEAVTGNIGSEQRKQYSITGDVVILASRIEQLNKEYDSRILASAEVLAAAGEAGNGHPSLGPVHVKGRNQPIEIYKLA